MYVCMYVYIINGLFFKNRELGEVIKSLKIFYKVRVIGPF